MHRILIVDDHPILRHGLIRLLHDEDDMEVCGEAGDAATALQLVETCTPDLVLLDLMLDHDNGIDVLRRMRLLRPDLAVIIVSMYDDADYLRAALEEGARGYLSKKEAGSEVVEAIRHVRRGHVYLSARMRDQLATALGSAPGLPLLVERLSEREHEVLRLIGQGYRPHQIAGQLAVSVRTINAHRQNMRRKLKLRSALELDRFAVEHLHGRRLP